MLNYTRAINQVMRDSRLRGPDLDRLVHRRLREVLVSAYRYVPHYRAIMQTASYDPTRDYSGPQDLERLPITTKQALKQKGVSAFIREGSDLGQVFVDSTSGSSGIPIQVYRDPQERSLQVAKWLRVLFKNGYSIRHRTMALVAPDRAEAQTTLQRLGILSRLTVDFMHHSPEKMVNILLDYSPHVLYGNRCHLDLMALELERRGVVANGLKLVVAGGEIIEESSRRLYHRRFGVELIENYGTVEMGVMAYETQAHDGLHLCTDLTYFEFLDQQGRPAAPGEPARVVVTDLAGKLMPFIRYDQGDLVTFQYRERHDDAPERVLTKVLGRHGDHAVLPDGTVCSPYTFSVLLKKFQGIHQFRVIQRAPGQFQILINADPLYVRTIHAELMERLTQEFPAGVRFEIVQVDRLDPDPSGKLRLLVCEAKAESGQTP